MNSTADPVAVWYELACLTGTCEASWSPIVNGLEGRVRLHSVGVDAGVTVVDVTVYDVVVETPWDASAYTTTCGGDFEEVLVQFGLTEADFFGGIVGSYGVEGTTFAYEVEREVEASCRD